MRARSLYRMGFWILGLALALGLGLSHFLGLESPPAFAQRSPKTIAAQVYEQLPGFPLENHYIRKEADQPGTDSTLVSRLIQYHTFVKGRSPQYRLDWKITLADYLGVNERVLEETYPGHDFLQANPIVGDLNAIQQLNLIQRTQLIQALVDVHGSDSSQAAPASADSPSPPDPSLSPSTSPQPVPAPTLQPLPQPGSADLLRFPTPPASGSTPEGESQKLLPPES